MNPRTGFEELLPAVPTPAKVRKRIAVIGAGCAGLKFAITAAQRGHTVDVFEKSDRMGGKMHAAEVHNIGDSYNTEKPGNMWQATKAAYNLASRI